MIPEYQPFWTNLFWIAIAVYIAANTLIVMLLVCILAGLTRISAYLRRLKNG